MLLAAITGCSDDPALHVTVTHPTSVAPAIASTTVTDYESPSLGCTDVEFAWLAPDQLAGLAIATETIDASGAISGNLDGISRVDHKVIVARGFDAAGALLAAGCAEQDVVDGSVELAIATEVAASPSIVVPTMPGMAVDVTVTDPMGALLANRAVSWTVYSAAGTTPTAMTSLAVLGDGSWRPDSPSCTQNGGVKIHPVPPGQVAGFAVQVGVAWAAEQPPLFTSLVTPTTSLVTLTPPANSIHYCTPHATGVSPRLACIDASGTATDYTAMVTTGGVTLAASDTQSVAGMPLEVVSVPNGTDRDAFAVGKLGNVTRLFHSGAVIDTALRAACATGCDEAIGVPACGDTHPGILVRQASTVMFFDLTSGALTTLVLANLPKTGLETNVRLDSAGCVTVLDQDNGTAGERQVMSLHFGTDLVQFQAIDSDLLYSNPGGVGFSELELPVESGIGFTSSASESRIVLSSLDATGVVVEQAVMITSGTHPFVERTLSPAASIPERLVAGEYDSDSTPDLFWSLTSRRDASATAVELAYARTISDGTELEALSGAIPVALDDLQSFDLTPGSGFDDLILTGTFASVARGVLVIPTDVAMSTSVASDPPCSP
ncbi:MAG TPA: hypothetical protein VGF94_28800 [Kofleriaceae bacterium]